MNTDKPVLSKRLIVLPRWGGTPASDWYPWLRRELEAVRPRAFEPVTVADMPDPEVPTIPAWVERVKELIGPDPELAARTVLLGHSVGGQALLRALAELPDSTRISGVLCVAGWFWTDDPWDSLLPWINTPFDLGRARAAAGRQIMVLISNNDRITSNWQATSHAWEERLGAAVVLVSGASHFNGERYPVILRTLLDHFADRPSYSMAGA